MVCSQRNRPLQLCFEFLAQLLRNDIVTLERLCHILLDGRMELDIHRLRTASTRFQNSASGTG